ncbi:hypothetical protein E2C01_018258 [Portunus trituberculatus]|uniref:Uncharacterized protein n=1 Tax=Portunus trituberculatus TaxID=210409 RepID=A0A5B7DVY6_PORTR|nr:hypothetical protein [Portunus trituberculatus]
MNATATFPVPPPTPALHQECIATSLTLRHFLTPPRLIFDAIRKSQRSDGGGDMKSETESDRVNYRCFLQ